MSKQIKTKIQLRYDTLANWNKADVANVGANYVPLKGEMCVVQIDTETQGSTLKPVMFKVGDGANKFSELDWASAKAADVYSWAKKSGIEIASSGSGNVVTGVSWDSANNKLVVTKGEATDTKNTAGATSTDDLLFLVGVKATGEYQQTFVHGQIGILPGSNSNSIYVQSDHVRDASFVVSDDVTRNETKYKRTGIDFYDYANSTNFTLGFPELQANATIATTNDVTTALTGYAKLASDNVFTAANTFEGDVAFTGTSSTLAFANDSGLVGEPDIYFHSPYVQATADSHFYFQDGIWVGGTKSTDNVTKYFNDSIVRNAAESSSDVSYAINLPSDAGTLALKEDFASSSSTPLKAFTAVIAGNGNELPQVYNGSSAAGFRIEVPSGDGTVTLNAPGSSSGVNVVSIAGKDSSGTLKTLVAKIKLPAADSSISDTTTSANYVSGTAVKNYVNDRIAHLTGFSILVPWTANDYSSSTAPTAAVLATIPSGVVVNYDNGAKTATGTLAATASGTQEHIYLIYHPHDGNDNFDEYVSTGTVWEKIGNTDIDLTDYARTDTSNEFIPAQNFGTINAYAVDPRGDASHDIGASSKRWRNLYLSGNLSDGTNTVAVADIAKKSDLKSKGSTTQPVYFDSNGVAQPISYTIAKSVPSDAVFTDTKNTAGATNNTDDKLYLIGATSQGVNPQTYSCSNVYISTGGYINAGSLTLSEIISGTTATVNIHPTLGISRVVGSSTYTLQFPSKSGTLAVTSDIPTEANIKSIIETYPGVNKTGTVTSITADATYLTGGTITTSGTIGVNTSKFILNDDSEIVILNGGSSTEVI